VAFAWPTKLSRVAPRLYSAHDELAAIASVESTFAGFYLDDTQAPVVLLTDTTRLSAALSAGLASSLSERQISTSRIRVRAATYSFGALKRWYELVAGGLTGEVERSINVVDNRLSFIVTSSAARDQALRSLAEQGIPVEAVEVKTGSPITLTSGTVRDRIRPLIGGIQTRLYKASTTPHDPPCTVGFFMKNASGRFFMSASHCSDSMYHFGTRPDSTWQNTMVAADYIGTKYEDPPAYSNCGSYPSPCRYSDAALWHLSSDSVTVGSIARTTYSDSIALAANPFVINDSGGWSTGTYHSRAIGATLWKTGRTTGMTGELF
jgi:hypothetical protein